MKEYVLRGGSLSREDALLLAETADTDALSEAADEIRRAFCGDDFDLCGVLSIRGGRCSENCRFCPQSCVSTAAIRSFPLLSAAEIQKNAEIRARQGVRHYCLVSNGRKPSDAQVTALCDAIRLLIRETGLCVCVSLGLPDAAQLRMLRDAGVSRIHNNLETSPGHFPSLCTSHTYAEKQQVIRDAHAAGLEVCSGGILGIGESMEDRIALALEERALGTESIPVNLLHAYPGTPLANQAALPDEEVRRTIAIFRFLLPRAYIRLAAGRDRMADTGRDCFRAGSNAAITGDMLNIKGITVEQDLQTIRDMGFQI